MLIIGLLMIAAVFGGIFGLAAFYMGSQEALLMFVVCAGLLAWLYVASWLISMGLG